MRQCLIKAAEETVCVCDSPSVQPACQLVLRPKDVAYCPRWPAEEVVETSMSRRLVASQARKVACRGSGGLVSQISHPKNQMVHTDTAAVTVTCIG